MYCVLQSAKTNLNVEEVCFSIARDIKQRLADTDSKAEVWAYLNLLFVGVASYMSLPVSNVEPSYTLLFFLSSLFCLYVF